MIMLKRSLQHLAMARVNNPPKSGGVDFGPIIREETSTRRLDWVSSKGSLIVTKDHPKIISCLNSQLKPIDELLPELSTIFAKLTGFDKVLITDYAIQAYHLVLRIVACLGQAKKNVPLQNLVLLATPSSFLGRCFPTGFPSWPKIKLISFNDLSALQEKLQNDNSICGILMDTIQWTDNIEEPGPGYLAEVRRTCDIHDVIWVADETCCGLGRTGHIMAYMAHGCHPHIVILSNTLGCGLYKNGVILAKEDELAKCDQQFITRCLSENNLILSIALEAIKLLENESLTNNAADMGDYLRNALKVTFSTDEIPQIRGRGLLTSIRVHGGIGKAEEICELMQQRGVSVWKCSDQCVCITPPLNTNEEQIIKGVKVLASVIDSLFEKYVNR